MAARSWCDHKKHTQWFTGKPFEDKIGLSYYGARWYDPTLGRFMAMDPVDWKALMTRIRLPRAKKLARAISMGIKMPLAKHSGILKSSKKI
ncbi:hypothetical protein FAZ21_05340 [Chitiniphilus eburneus]|uniref:Uncharacterized protein n=1 Tax=Chitiniphilus eburneus TaxID=2571148 RepID=A0A4U0Q5I4_9NEIS|nr:hypothetical protein FAZ21_05340 [Chitiniphilus eburneus]